MTETMNKHLRSAELDNLRTYVKPECNVLAFKVEDVLSASVDNGGNDLLEYSPWQPKL